MSSQQMRSGQFTNSLSRKCQYWSLVESLLRENKKKPVIDNCVPPKWGNK